MNKEHEQVLQELSKPFSPQAISWLPGSITKDKTKALALAYADLRAYMNRLDEVCGLDWSVAYTPWGSKLICHLTINGVTRSSVGEPTDESEKGEIDGTVTEAQAFKRACVMFGLGRYLYTFPQSWQPIDEYKRFTKEAEGKLTKLVADHYNRTVKPEPAAQHRPARPPADQQPATTGDNPFDDEQDIDFGMKDSKPVPGVFVWPVREDELKAPAGLIHITSVQIPELSFRLMSHIMKEDSASGDKILSEKQYGLLAGKLDAKYGKPAHRAILSALCQRVVTGEAMPGWKCKVLIDWLMKPEENAAKLEALDGVVAAIKESAPEKV